MSNAIVPVPSWTDEQKQLAKKTVCRGASDAEFELFLAVCTRTGLDPFARQIYAVRRKQWNAETRTSEEAQIIQISIDGSRLIADRTAKYSGQVGPWWCGKDGEWKEVWLEDEPPAAAKVGVLRSDFHQPMFSTALYKAYVQTNRDGKPISRWATDPAGMLAKCAESLALRRAFPQELSGLYTSEEMGQADNTAVPIEWHAEPITTGAVTQTTTPEPPEYAEEGQVVEEPAAPAPATKQRPTRPYTAEQVKAGIDKAAQAKQGVAANDQQRGLLVAMMEKCYAGSGANDKRHAAFRYLTGVPSIKAMPDNYVVAMLDWLKPTKDSGGDYMPNPMAEKEAQSVHTASLVADGQEAML